MAWLFGSSHDENVTHGRILDAVEKCQEGVSQCAQNIAVIQATLGSGGDKFKDLDARINALEVSVNGSMAVGRFAKVWILPTALATLGTAALIVSGLMWLGDRLDDDHRHQVAPDPPAKVRP